MDIWRGLSRASTVAGVSANAVLLAEREPASREYIERQLRDDGFTVFGAGWTARALRHVTHDGAGLLPDLQCEHCAAFGIRIGLVVAPAQARRHLHQRLHADALESGAGKFGKIPGQRIVDALNITILDGGAHQRGAEGFCHRHREPARGGIDAEVVVFEQDLVILHYQNAGDAIARDIVVDVESAGHGDDRKVRQVTLRISQRPHRRTSLDDARREIHLGRDEGPQMIDGHRSAGIGIDDRVGCGAVRFACTWRHMCHTQRSILHVRRIAAPQVDYGRADGVSRVPRRDAALRQDHRRVPLIPGSPAHHAD